MLKKSEIFLYPKPWPQECEKYFSPVGLAVVDYGRSQQLLSDTDAGYYGVQIMSEQRKAYFYAAAAVLLWSTVASAFKVSLRYSDVLCLLFWASLVSTFVLFCIVLLSGKLPLLKVCSGAGLVRSALLGFLNPFCYYVVLLKAYSLLPAQQALTLNFLWPIMLVLLSMPLLGQKISLRAIAAILISFAGVVVIATQGDVRALKFTSAAGVSLALASSVIWALFWLYNLTDKRDEVVKLFLNFAFGCCFIFAAVVLLRVNVFAQPKALFGALYIGLFEMGITFLLWIRALKLSKTTAGVANLVYLVPFLSIVCIHFVVAEPILASTLIGLALIITGIILQKL